MYKAAIVGSEGYAFGELVSLLVNHPDVVLERIYAPERAGLRVSDLHPGLFEERSIEFTSIAKFDDIDILFLCVPSSMSRQFLSQHQLPENVRIIDFAVDHRSPNSTDPDGFVYGLSEKFRRQICSAQKVSLPGCFAMSIELALLPLAVHGLIRSDIHICSVSGRTEIIARPKAPTHAIYDLFFDNFSVYKPFNHPQLAEVQGLLQYLGVDPLPRMHFIPMRGNFNRGIYTTLYTTCDLGLNQLQEMYKDYYGDHSFVHLITQYPDVRDTINTNHALIHLCRQQDLLLVTCTLDNLMKGAAGTAVHIMNLMTGLVENTGLKIKASAY